jgi:hypothetical protein
MSRKKTHEEFIQKVYPQKYPHYFVLKRSETV